MTAVPPKKLALTDSVKTLASAVPTPTVTSLNITQCAPANQATKETQKFAAYPSDVPAIPSVPQRTRVSMQNAFRSVERITNHAVERPSAWELITRTRVSAPLALEETHRLSVRLLVALRTMRVPMIAAASTNSVSVRAHMTHVKTRQSAQCLGMKQSAHAQLALTAPWTTDVTNCYSDAERTLTAHPVPLASTASASIPAHSTPVASTQSVVSSTSFL